MTTAAIELRGVTKRFGSTLAVQNLDLVVPTGSLCGFLGPNGAGKSTTIRMIMSIIYPDSGHVQVLGGSALASKDRIGYLPEERGVYRRMRVGEFLEFMGKLKGLSGRDSAQRSRHWLDRVELGAVYRKRCQELSKGMQQKVQFLAAIIHDPELLIFDEPFSGLDPVNSALMQRIIEELHAGGRTVIFSTHVLHQAEQLCQRIFLIDHGEKLLDGTLDEIRAQFDPRTILVEPMEWSRRDAVRDAARFGVDGLRMRADAGAIELLLRDGADPTAVMRGIVAEVPVRSIEIRRVTLEEVFIRKVRQGRSEISVEDAWEELVDG